MDAAYPRWEFPAGVHLSIGEEGEKVKGGPAAITGASTTGFKAPPAPNDVEEVILQPHDGIIGRRRQICVEKGGELLPSSELQFCPLPHWREAIEGEAVGQPSQYLRQRQHLIDVLPGEG